jgi:SAM-dependent methyltransferase
VIRSGPSPYDRAKAYHALHAPNAPDGARTILRVARAALGQGRTPRLWYEPACGTARLLIALSRLPACRDARFVGADLSVPMLRLARDLARRNALTARLRLARADIRVYAPAGLRGRVDAAFCPDNSVRHLPTDGAMVEHLLAVRALLAPGGVYLVGVGLHEPDAAFTTEDVLHRRVGATVYRQVFEFLPPDPAARGPAARRERALVHLSVAGPSTSLDESAAYDLRTYTREQWGGVLARAKMRQARVLDDSGRDLDPGWTGYAWRVLTRA